MSIEYGVIMEAPATTLFPRGPRRTCISGQLTTSWWTAITRRFQWDSPEPAWRISNTSWRIAHRVISLARNPATAGRVKRGLAVGQDCNVPTDFAMFFSQEVAMYVIAITPQVAKVRLATFVNWITVSASMFLESTADATVRFAKVTRVFFKLSLSR